MKAVKHQLTKDIQNRTHPPIKVVVTTTEWAIDVILLNAEGEGSASVYIEMGDEGQPVLRVWDAMRGMGNDPRIRTTLELEEG